MQRQQSDNKAATGLSGTCAGRATVAAGLRLPPAVLKSRVWPDHSGHANFSPLQAKKWSMSCLLDSRPSGRFDVWELRNWVHTRLQRLKHRCGGQELGQPSLVKYAEQVVDVYNAAFQELTCQVALGCNDRGQFMADIWTSTNVLLGRVLEHVKTQTDGFKAMALALKRKEAVMDDACSRLHQLVKAKTKEVDELRQHMQTLEERLENAESALWDQGQKDSSKRKA